MNHLEPLVAPLADESADESHDLALLRLGQHLNAENYRFVTVTPLTHQRVNAREGNRQARSLRDIFGWSRPFESDLLPEAELEALLDSGVLRAHAGMWVSDVRWSCLDDLLFVHSSFPTVANDSVFFGPDTYRFAQAIEEHLRSSSHPVRTAVDIGCGSGAGAILIARARRDAQVLAVDINPTALRFTAVNAALAGTDNVSAYHSDILEGTSGEFDLIVANPPYMQDTQERAYRHGGDHLGSALSVRILSQAVARLTVGGSLVLYTGAPSVDGVDLFLEQARAVVDRTELAWTYREMDPDVFGEELDTAPYQQADRIAAVVLTVTRSR
ncbi:class I SAM-dependent methyltransferase [Pseudomonas sp. LP_7_YM]|uniref:methyltransferase n=1 Tax=Pseudomonas sp. LP_7_YM TaxID=2485137 RepID=UPI00106130FE|nr:class I SAM-dependent methyltransferase [Pseudomonas sp. LP_7_YM]TDV72249.1 methyltransferase family protein [Pseudomonas sp. LP_7_YM]